MAALHTSLRNIKFLQVNLNRSRQAHDLALATANEMNVDILIVSEPNRLAISNRTDWIFDRELDVGVKVLSNMPIRSQGSGPGFAFVSIPEITVYSVYSSGNNSIDHLEDTLSNIERRLRSRNENAIIAGDFNAKSPQWGMHITDRRGETVTEWMAANDLTIANQGKKPTFHVQGYSSILDLTIATSNVINSIVNWDVSDKETLSDHNYITFDVEMDKGVIKEATKQRGWQVRSLNQQKLINATDRITCKATHVTSAEYTSQLIQICDEAMQKRKKFAKRQPAYWWTSNIGQLRKASIHCRRLYTRSVRRNSPEVIEQLWKDYKESKKTLRNAIKAAKRESWKKLCSKIDTDIWGDGYKLVMKMMNGFPPKPNLTIDEMEAIARELFPVHSEVNFSYDADDDFPSFNEEELILACQKIKNKKAPGPRQIPPEVIKLVATHRPDYMLSVYNELARNKKFPEEWKVASLVLLRKANKSLNDPTSYRPICLLDAEGKLFEQLLSKRLKIELQRTGGLSNMQFGFREQRQTVDAVLEIVRIAKEAESFSAQQRQICAVVTLDVKNAFNSASWQLILEKLLRRNINGNLLRIIQSYLSDRKILLEIGDTKRVFKINSGVPQGSVLGPTLWNVLYDDLLRQDYPEGVTVIGFADDIALVATDRYEHTLMGKVNIGLMMVADWMRHNLLELAPQKTEAVLLTKKRKLERISFELLGNNITPQKVIKYLGVWLDRKLAFYEHVSKAIEKADRTVSALSKLMPNVGGPRASKRRVLASVVNSQLLYGAPVWRTAIENKKVCRKLLKIQRQMAIRVSSAYRTISTEAVGVIAGIPPIDLQVTERSAKYNGIAPRTAKEQLMAQWQERWERGTFGRWTCRLIPNINRWISRPHGEVDYYVTQALSGHGCFNKYLYERRLKETGSCTYCNAEVDDAEHTLFLCLKWSEARTAFLNNVGREFNERNMMESLIKSEEGWVAAYNTIRYILETKAKESR